MECSWLLLVGNALDEWGVITREAVLAQPQGRVSSASTTSHKSSQIYTAYWNGGKVLAIFVVPSPDASYSR